VLDEPEVMVMFEDFGDNALIFDAYFWADVNGERGLRQIRSAARFRIDEMFHEAGIVIAFPQRDVHMDTLAPLDVRIVEKAADPTS
jgi:small-conductance mechanosensitive channel